MKIKFPERSSDGTGVAELMLSLGEQNPDEFVARAQPWLSSFVQANPRWEFVGHEFRLDEAFLEAPAVFRDGHTVGIRLELRHAHEKLWKDWLAYALLPNLSEAFPGVAFASARSPKASN